ncbi:hypothetical protein L9F63_027770, partial [Diploptera punctata]
GETGSHLYVSAEGSFVVYVGCSKINTFGPGVAFGELAILYNTKRNATIQATMTNFDTFQSLGSQPTGISANNDAHKIARHRGISEISSQCSFVKDLSSHILAKMSDFLQVFHIFHGVSVKIAKLEHLSQMKPGAEKELGVYSHGQYFGELALLKEDTRQATVTAMAPGVECYMSDLKTFIIFIGKKEEFDRATKNQLENRRICVMLPNENNEVSAVNAISAIAHGEYGHVELNELTYVGTLGVGGFGRVELVQYKKNKKLTFNRQQEEHAYNEKGVMMACSDCPFISKLYRTYRDNKYVYFLMEACLGGDVFTHTARFMTACVVEALHYLHDRGFIYRDLKPENLLLDEKGYVKMIDFGFAKRVGHSGKTWTFAGTPEYVAPEIILNKGHDRAVDYWALGVFIHELITGRYIHFPKHVTKGAQNLVRRLCQPFPQKELDTRRLELKTSKRHKWFQDFNWEALRKRRIMAPVIRPIKGPTDLSNFDKYPKNTSVPLDETSGWDKDF